MCVEMRKWRKVCGYCRKNGIYMKKEIFVFAVKNEEIKRKKCDYTN